MVDQVLTKESIKILKKKHGIEFSGFGNELPTMLEYIKSMGGIDYEKTQAPVSREASQFSDTFNEPDVVEFLSSELVLISGEVIHYHAFSKCNLEDYYKAMELFKLQPMIDEFTSVENNEI